MYSIGDLSQLGGVTPRMLRHYHALGILIPAEVDDSGYRRYDETQLADLLRVVALKGLGFPLGDIKRITEGDVSPAELRGMLLLRRAELESERDEADARQSYAFIPSQDTLERNARVDEHEARAKRDAAAINERFVKPERGQLVNSHGDAVYGNLPYTSRKGVGETLRPAKGADDATANEQLHYTHLSPGERLLSYGQAQPEEEEQPKH